MCYSEGKAEPHSLANNGKASSVKDENDERSNRERRKRLKKKRNTEKREDNGRWWVSEEAEEIKGKQ